MVGPGDILIGRQGLGHALVELSTTCSHLASRRGRARRVGWRLAGPGTSTHVTGQRSATRPPRGKGWAWGPAVSPASHGKGTSSGYMKIVIHQAEAKAGSMMPWSCPSQPSSSAAFYKPQLGALSTAPGFYFVYIQRQNGVLRNNR